MPTLGPGAGNADVQPVLAKSNKRTFAGALVGPGGDWTDYAISTTTGNDGYGDSAANDFSTSSIFVGSETDRLLYAFFRFTGVAVGISTPVTAVLNMNVLSANGGTSLRIRAIAEDNPATIAAFSDLTTGRPKTTAYVDWAPESFYPLNSVDVSPVVQEIVDRPGWVSGNAILFVIEPLTSGIVREAQIADFSAGATNAARLSLLQLTTGRTKSSSDTGTGTEATSTIGLSDIDSSPYLSTSDDFHLSGAWSPPANGWDSLLMGASGGTAYSLPLAGSPWQIAWRTSGAPTTDNNSAEAVIQPDLSGGLNVNLAVTCRGNGNTNTGAASYYAFQANFNTGAYRLVRVNGGVRTNLGVTYTGKTPASGDLLRVEAIGSLIRGYINGEPVLSVVDTTITTGKFCGLEQVTGDPYAHRWDNFRCGDVVPRDGGESVATGIFVNGSDTAGATDAASLVASGTSADTGAGTEAQSIATALTSADTATAVEASSISQSAADTASATETASVAIALAGADTATGTEAASLAVTQAASDSASGTETVTAAAKTAADTAGASDAASVTTALSSADTGTGTEAASLATALTSSDSASGVDAAQARQLTSADTATATDATQARQLASADTATAIDAAQTRQLTTADTVSATDAASLAVTQGDTDGSPRLGVSDDFSTSVGFSTRWQTVDFPLPTGGRLGSDVGAIAWYKATLRSTADNSAEAKTFPGPSGRIGVVCRGNQGLTNAFTGYAMLADGFTGNFRLSKIVAGTRTDLATLSVAPVPGDTVRVEAVGSKIRGYVNGSIVLTAVDTSITSGVHTGVWAEFADPDYYSWFDDFRTDDVTERDAQSPPAVTLTAADTAAATDATGARNLTATDTATATDQVTSRSLTGADTATGAEDQSVLTDVQKSSADTASGTEAASLAVAVSSSDSGAATDAASLAVARTSSDTASGTEAATLAAALSSTDAATGTENQSLLTDVQKSSSDSASGTDAASLTAALSRTDTAAASDAVTAGVRATTTGDTASTAEAASVTILLTSSDTATASETGTLATALTSSQTATGVEAVTARGVASDDGASTTDLTGSVTTSNNPTSSDAATVSEATSLVVTINSSDAATTVEHVLLGYGQRNITVYYGKGIDPRYATGVSRTRAATGVGRSGAAAAQDDKAVGVQQRHAEAVP